MLKNSLVLAFSCCFLWLQAQDFSPIQASVAINNIELPNPFAGGLNTPQPSSVDLNNDGLSDLYIFDRAGDIHLTFLRLPNQAGYRFAPEYAENFPPVENWVLLRDYNNDGIMDLFAYPDVQVAGVMVYTGFYDVNNRLSFQRYQFHNSLGLNIATFPLNGGGEAQVYVSNIDYPAIDDMDCDGDLDILTFNLAGGYVELYSNRSVEEGFGQDSLRFKWVENCWGGFYESGVSNVVDLSPALGQCINLLTDDNDLLEQRHAGSTLLTFDADDDGDKELILGDLSFDWLNFLTNGGTCQEAWMTNQDSFFPSYDVSLSLPTFPVAFYLDVSADGDRDLLVAPNVRQSGEDKNVLWRYENVGSNAQPVFDFQENDFLVDGMVDMGTGTKPVLVDVNADGLLDLVVGNLSRYLPFGAKDPRIYLFENQGTATTPQWVLTNEDYLGMNQFAQASFGFTPTFGDLDDDGDLDVLVGEQNGRLFYGVNQAGPGQPFQFGTLQYNYGNIHIGQASVPLIVDINRDGLSDLLIGEQNGNINYFPNIGSPGQPLFNADPASSPNVFFFGQVDARIPGYSTGNSSPIVLEINEQYQLFTGTQNGRVERYLVNESNPSAVFSLLTDQLGGLRDGNKTHISFGDVNADGWLDMVTGNFRGGLNLVSTDIPTGSITAINETTVPSNWLNLYPNPSSDRVFASVDATDEIRGIEVFSSNGVLQYRFIQAGIGATAEFSVAGWPSGLYIVKVTTPSKVCTKKLLVNP